MPRTLLRLLCLFSMLAALATLTGCDMLGIESASSLAAKKEAEGNAVGGACRHAGRALEDCYTLNKKADKGAVFAGWREMNDYMRENKIDEVAPQLPQAGKPAKPKGEEADAEHAEESEATGTPDKPVKKKAKHG
jgi:hypothetical protein